MRNAIYRQNHKFDIQKITFRCLTLLALSIITVACNQQQRQNTYINIYSTPPGAIVSESLHGKLGAAPTKLTISESSCPKQNGQCILNFHFTKSGYEAKTIERRIYNSGAFSTANSEIIVHAHLNELKTELSVRGYPTFAEYKISYRESDNIWRDLKLTGKHGVVPSLLDEEPWQGKDYALIKLNFESPGYFPMEKIITIRKGEKKVIEYSLEEYTVMGLIDSNPSGADVYERSLGYLGRTPFQIKIPYEKLVRISPQRSKNLNEPIFLHLKFSKPGYNDLKVISSIGEIDEMEEPEDFSISQQLQKLRSKR